MAGCGRRTCTLSYDAQSPEGHGRATCDFWERCAQGVLGSLGAVPQPSLRARLLLLPVAGQAEQLCGTDTVGSGERLQPSAWTSFCEGGNAHPGYCGGFPGLLILYPFPLV